MPDYFEETSGDILEKKKVKIPGLYRVILHNDDYSTVDFVIEVLRTIFHHSLQNAEQITMNVHRKGKGVAGIYPKDIAVSKVKHVHQMAKEREFPLMASYEPV